MDIDLRDRMCGQQDVTQCLQSAIDEVAQAGGGKVALPEGEHVCGPLNVKSNVHLFLEAGACILGRWVGADLSAPALIHAEGAENVTISGDGLIDARGSEEVFPRGTKQRPLGFSIRNCRNVTVKDIRFRNSPSWAVVFRQCDGVVVEGVTVDDHNNYNNDGIDLVDCSHARISHCDVSADDDGICLKSFTERGCHDIEIAHCRIASHCNALKTGTESYGAFRNVHIHDCEIERTRADRVFFGKPGGQSAVCLTNVDGADLDGIHIHDIVIRSGTDIPFCLKLGARLRPYDNPEPRPVGTFRNVTLENIRSRNTLNSPNACPIAGVVADGVTHCLENITLRNIELHLVGDVEGDFKVVEERPRNYPHPYVLGPLPACGIYCRHVNGLRMENIAITRMSTDKRPAIYCANVAGLEAEGVDVHRE